MHAPPRLAARLAQAQWIELAVSERARARAILNELIPGRAALRPARAPRRAIWHLPSRARQSGHTLTVWRVGRTVISIKVVIMLLYRLRLRVRRPRTASSLRRSEASDRLQQALGQSRLSVGGRRAGGARAAGLGGAAAGALPRRPVGQPLDRLVTDYSSPHHRSSPALSRSLSRRVADGCSSRGRCGFASEGRHPGTRKRRSASWRTVRFTRPRRRA